MSTPTKNPLLDTPPPVSFQSPNKLYSNKKNPRNHHRSGNTKYGPHNTGYSPQMSSNFGYPPNHMKNSPKKQNGHNKNNKDPNTKWSFIDYGNNSYRPMMDSNSFNSYNQHLNLLLQQNNLFYPKPHWFWALENFKKKCLGHDFDLSFSIDENDESFLACQIINLFLQQASGTKENGASCGQIEYSKSKANNNILYILEDQNQLIDRKLKIHRVSSRKMGTLTEISETKREEYLSGKVKFVFFTQASQFEDPEFYEQLDLEKFNLIIIETGSSLKSRNLPKQHNNIKAFKEELIFKRNGTEDSCSKSKCPIITLYKSVIDMNLDEGECQELTTVAKDLNVDGSHTHLHTFFNNSINNVIEYSLNSGSVNPETMRVSGKGREIEKDTPLTKDAQDNTKQQDFVKSIEGVIEEPIKSINNSEENTCTSKGLLDDSQAKFVIEPTQEHQVKIEVEPESGRQIEEQKVKSFDSPTKNTCTGKFTKDKSIASEWKRYLPFCETFCGYRLDDKEEESEKESKLSKQLSQVISNELDLLEQLLTVCLEQEEVKLEIWPSQAKTDFTVEGDISNHTPNSSGDANESEMTSKENQEQNEGHDEPRPSITIQPEHLIHGRKDHSRKHQDYYPRLSENTRKPILVNFNYSLKMAQNLIDKIRKILVELGVWSVYRFLTPLVSRSANDLLKEDVENDPHPPVVLTSLFETSLKQIWLQLQIEIRPLCIARDYKAISELNSNRLLKLLSILKDYGTEKSENQKMKFTLKKDGADWLEGLEDGKDNEQDMGFSSDEFDENGDIIRNENKLDMNSNMNGSIDNAVREETVAQAKRSLTGIVLVKDKTISQMLTRTISDFATWIDKSYKHIYPGAVSVDDNNNIDKDGEDTIHSYRQASTNLLVALPDSLLKSKQNKFIKKKPSEIPRCNLVIMWNEIDNSDYFLGGFCFFSWHSFLIFIFNFFYLLFLELFP